MTVRISKSQLAETFRLLRDCGRGERECQVLWLNALDDPRAIFRVIHPQHTAHAGGFRLEDSYINTLWLDLAKSGNSVRVQVHTHPDRAFHSTTDDNWPIVHTSGFLSLVIPNLACGLVGLEKTFLVQIDSDGHWREVDTSAVIWVTQ